MPSKNTVNHKDVLKELEKKISPVLVVNNSSLKPYVELFDYAPENIYQQPLGSLVGFFEVKEYSDDSAYVVNFLTSVLKKEYYINPKRPVTESLDSALHKVNMALSELAKHGNIQWLGKLNAAICVLEKNNAHFSVSGNAKIFLFRNSILTEISEDLASDSPEPHPLKTFVNVSSGRMENEDRLLITSEDIFHIFSAVELKKNFQRFEGDKFVQFLKTALSNQMEMIASLVVEISNSQQSTMPKLAPNKTPQSAANVFSEKTFTEPTASTLSIEESLTLMDTVESDAEYTDKKTGHIYVQGEASNPSENAKVALYLESAKEKASEAWYLTKNETRRRYAIYKKQLIKKLEEHRKEKERLAEIKKQEAEKEREEKVLLELELEEKLAREQEAERILLQQQEKEKLEYEKLHSQKISDQQNQEVEKKQSSPESQIVPEISKEEYSIIAEDKHIEVKKEQEATKVPETELSFKEKLELAVKQQKRQSVIDLRGPKKISPNEEMHEVENANEFDEKSFPVRVRQQEEINQKIKEEKAAARKALLQKTVSQIIGTYSNTFEKIKKQVNSITNTKNLKFEKSEQKHIAPRFSKIKKSFSGFTSKQKIYTIAALAIVFIVPLFIVHFMNQPAKPTITQLPSVQVSQADALSNDKNMILITNQQTILSKTNLINTLIISDGYAVITKNSVVIFNNNNQPKEFPIPANDGNAVRASFMKDLSLILIMTDQKKVVSFSPVSQKFSENNIDLPGNVSQKLIGTYLTYLYVLDSSANQVYRYPRADGGFGESTNWIKGSINLNETSDMAMDDSIYTIQNNQVVKYFKGQIQSFALENSQTPIEFDKISTSIDSPSLWVLDTKNSRIIQFTKDKGTITSQYYNENLKNGSSFTVDEENKTAYITTFEGLISIKLQ